MGRSRRRTRGDVLLAWKADYFHLCRGRHLSYQRGKRNTNPSVSLLQIEGVDDPKAARYGQDAKEGNLSR